MAAGTAISWADDTFNPWEGCTRVSPACDHCYAAERAQRFGNDHLWSGTLRRTSPANWRKPLKWNDEARLSGKPRRVFCASLCDVFDNQAPPEWRADLWELIATTPHLTWMLLTKRIGNVKSMIPVMDSTRPGYRPWNVKWPWPNVWIGATIANQAEADRDIPKLLATPAALRFVSMEPLLGSVDLTMLRCDGITNINALTGGHGVAIPMRGRGVALDWVIVGGESGRDARPMHPEWARALRDQCADAGVPFHFKQWGEYLPEGQLDGAGFEWAPGEDGRVHWWGPEPMVGEHLHDGHCSIRIGKHQAGRTLDDTIHDAMPGGRAQLAPPSSPPAPIATRGTGTSNSPG